MKLALLGYGKMGKIVEKIAIEKGHEVTMRFSQKLGTLQKRKKELDQVDLAIDFSHPSCVISHLEICLACEIPLVIGTTGWEDHQDIAQEMVAQMKGSCFYAPNFSMGVFLFQQIVTYAASLMKSIHEYDVSGLECHHRQKLDAPSGTAKMLARCIQEQMGKESNDHSLFASVRCGHNPGLHSIYFDSVADSITLTHQARNREGFAYGAITAAEWILSRKGFFTFEDMLRG